MDYVKFRKDIEMARRFSVVYWLGSCVLTIVIAALVVAVIVGI